MVVGSKPGGVTGRVTVSAAAEYLIELAHCPVLILARGVALTF
jgi:nucleotide-binding universal stress UspA family protein